MEKELYKDKNGSILINGDIVKNDNGLYYYVSISDEGGDMLNGDMTFASSLGLEEKYNEKIFNIVMELNMLETRNKNLTTGMKKVANDLENKIVK